ncbi:hypothetical protein VPNG_10294 [Cytospora leucostoma]|uniref:Branched-chain amino acid aminotransferase n=1 Tax=Cytospora leucostoma TaxID=1230097 RepID=A0A423VBT5_9PEZI|nr:hypothetical protein VPNG_10294 [Cytospora leucostoma]
MRLFYVPTYLTRRSERGPAALGNRKLGANHGPCILPRIKAAERGFQQKRWLFGEDQRLTEAGALNVSVILGDGTGRLKLATPELDGTTLEGVTRDSVLALARERLVAKEGWLVSERVITMPELAMLSPICAIRWNGELVSCGLAPGQEAGKTAVLFQEWIEEIQCGELEHESSNPV